MIKHQPSAPVTVIITRDQAVWRLDITAPLPTEPEIRKHAFVWLQDRLEELDLVHGARKQCRRTLAKWLTAGRPHKGIRLVVCDEAVTEDKGVSWLKKMMKATLDPGEYVKKMAKKTEADMLGIPSMGVFKGYDDNGNAVIELPGGQIYKTIHDESARKKHAKLFAKATCPHCGGTGQVSFGVKVGNYDIGAACAFCGGTGKV